MAKLKVNWLKIKKEFLHSRYESLKDVASKCGISYGYFRKVAMKHNWTTERKEFWKEVDKVIGKEIERSIKEKIIESYRKTLGTNMEQKATIT